ncbi:double-strand break repair helicase AddA [Hyphomicrobium sp.]|uniref:double-strand break repair helicase AddA n=2 Tax=Hyphomicrobium sp. TaxID=82 RepID=UPI00132729C9|nr:double-strand break repair helicase AddA [Hyphomicrobium sp.]KAB2941848.1 MAG: double-strand break repair helicase AddA [Hyphomicrobium sp.]
MSMRRAETDAERTRRAQRDAADPRASVWVSANAGTGKTHVLTQRVLRLMLAGTKPERLLCLTYTKAAAAEMAKRVFDTLAQWVTLPDAELAAQLGDLCDRPASIDEVAYARTLFAVAIETPGGLKVQTIHSFCERLLQRFPLEADVAPGFSVLDDTTANALLREATDITLREATDGSSPSQRQALEAVIPYAAEDRFDEVLRAALRQRRWLDSALRIDLGEHTDELAGLESVYRRSFGVRAEASIDDIESDMADVVGDAELSRLRDALSGGTASDQNLAQSIAAALAAPSSAARAAALEDYFCTDSGPRKRLMTKAIAAGYPELDAAFATAQARFTALAEERRGLRAITATIALHRLAGAVLQRYTLAKRRRAALDYDDLISKSVFLLSGQELAAWVMFKLDRGIDHILVDEAQDTSPEQWQIVEALAREFFTGGGQHENIRTLFAVGDEKQSIYSFQGAAPHQFAEMGARFAALSGNGSWRRIPLDLSFRTVAPVLDAVDRVFADGTRTPGLTTEAAVVRHAVHRLGHGGLIEVWPTEVPDADASADPWSPLEEKSGRAPAERLADRIATTIRRWLDEGEMLASEGRPVRAGDILILVRKRRPFAGPMVAALKARGIQVAGADRLRLSEQIAVEDLMSLGDFLTLPEDDLALAEVLKSPLIGLDDDDLLALAAGRKSTLWKSLIDHAGDDERYRVAADALKRWRSRADFVPPFEFFASILDREGGRAKLLARLGAEAADPIDEFLNLALAYDDAVAPSLTGFLAHLREVDREVKRDMEHGRDEVRVMTVHGAKGLEAPIVFLPDTCSTATGGPITSLLDIDNLELPEGADGTPFVWSVKGTSGHAAISAARRARAQRETEERNRLLYVAMTRARDRLYITGFEGKNGQSAGCWYELISGGLRDVLEQAQGADGMPVQRRMQPQSVPPKRRDATHKQEAAAAQLPAWATNPAPREAALSIPLAPSRLEAYAPDDAGEPLPSQPSYRRPAEEEPPVPPPAARISDHRFLRGTLTHALLQHLPTLPASGWENAAAGFLETRGNALSPSVRCSIAKETLAILTAPEFAALFGPQSRAEVPIVALIPNPQRKGPPLKLIGQLDRLVDLGDEVLIVDYKTNRPPPTKVEQVAPAYLFQLAAYRMALREIYAGRRVRTALLWTDGPRIMTIPDALLDAYTGRLFDLDVCHLDARGGHS